MNAPVIFSLVGIIFMIAFSIAGLQSIPEMRLQSNPPTPTPSALSSPTEKSTPPVTTPLSKTTTLINSPSPKSIAAISFVDLPATVAPRQKFAITWKITGPDGASGSDTTLRVSYENHSDNNNSNSSVSSKSTQSFGSFQVPKTFSSQFSFGSDSAPINIDISAVVDGQTISTHRTIQLVQ